MPPPSSRKRASARRDFVDLLGDDIGCWESTLAAIENRVLGRATT